MTAAVLVRHQVGRLPGAVECPYCGELAQKEVKAVSGMQTIITYLHEIVISEDGGYVRRACRPLLGVGKDRCSMAHALGYPYATIRQRLRERAALVRQMVKTGRNACPVCGLVAAVEDGGIVLCRDEVEGHRLYLHRACRYAGTVPTLRYTPVSLGGWRSS